MSEGIVVSLCDYSTSMVRPWADAGFVCYCIDLQHPTGEHREGNIVRVGADILRCVSEWLPPLPVRIAFAFPPCTHTAVSGARHFQAKGPRAAAEAFTLIARVDALVRWWGCPYLWEQPVATTSTYAGPPTHTFDPCDFAGYADDPSADAYTKRTCVWSGGGLRWPSPKPIEPVKVCAQGSWVQRLGGKSLATGFADAIFQANQ